MLSHKTSDPTNRTIRQRFHLDDLINSAKGLALLATLPVSFSIFAGLTCAYNYSSNIKRKYYDFRGIPYRAQGDDLLIDYVRADKEAH